MSGWGGTPLAAGLALGLSLAAVVSLLAWRGRALTAPGAGVAVGLGSIAVGLGGFTFGVAVAAFFVSSVVAGRLGSGPSALPRDGWQVLANGGPATLFAFAGRISGEPALVAAAFGALAAACADTWASEIGAKVGGPTRRLLPPGEVAPGDQGGVSLAGSLAAVGGAVLIGLITLVVFHPATALAVIVGGLFGALLDSVLGGWLEPRPGHPGLNFYDNNLNNATATLVAGLVTASLVSLT